MSTKNKIAGYLKETFSGMACNICDNKNDDGSCDEMDCRSMFYLSIDTARDLADEILDIVKRGM